MSGVTTVTQTAAQGGQAVGGINNGDWMAFTPYALGNATSFTAQVARATTGSSTNTIQVQAGSATGTSAGHGDRCQHGQCDHLPPTSRLP